MVMIIFQDILENEDGEIVAEDNEAFARLGQ